MAYLPIIDLSKARVGDADAMAAASRAIDRVCREQGFFYVVGHGIPQELIDRVFDASRSFFEQSEDVKQRTHLRLSPNRRGYESLGHQSLDPGKPSDLLEAFTIGLDHDPGQPRDPPVPRRGPNQWPDEAVAPGFAAASMAYMTALEALSRHLMALLALGLGLPQTYFDAFMRRPAPTLRLLHYPPQPTVVEPDQIGCGAHTDWGALTLLAQDKSGGLQVRDPSGQWREVPPVDRSFIVNLGDMMARWTNDRYHSTVHRVINRVSGRDRYSMPYFFDIDFDSLVSALPGCHDEFDPPRYPAVTAGEHHGQKLMQSRGGYL